MLAAQRTEARRPTLTADFDLRLPAPSASLVGPRDLSAGDTDASDTGGASAGTNAAAGNEDAQDIGPFEQEAVASVPAADDAAPEPKVGLTHQAASFVLMHSAQCTVLDLKMWLNGLPVRGKHEAAVASQNAGLWWCALPTKLRK